MWRRQSNFMIKLTRRCSTRLTSTKSKQLITFMSSNNRRRKNSHLKAIWCSLEMTTGIWFSIWWLEFKWQLEVFEGIKKWSTNNPGIFISNIILSWCPGDSEEKTMYQEFAVLPTMLPILLITFAKYSKLTTNSILIVLGLIS